MRLAEIENREFFVTDGLTARAEPPKLRLLFRMETVRWLEPARPIEHGDRHGTTGAECR
jgi:hypothetical protein